MSQVIRVLPSRSAQSAYEGWWTVRLSRSHRVTAWLSAATSFTGRVGGVQPTAAPGPVWRSASGAGEKLNQVPARPVGTGPGAATATSRPNDTARITKADGLSGLNSP